MKCLIFKSLFSRRFPAPIFYGALICLFINIIELDYNIAALVVPSAPSAGAGQIVGGFVAGFLQSGTRRDALKAGGYAGGLPILVLGPLALILRIGTQSVALPLGSIALQYVFGFLLVYPFMIGMGSLFGGIGAFVGQWLSRKRS